MSVKLEFQPELVCTGCGQAGAFALGDGGWCAECYAEVSSSCAGGGQEAGDNAGAASTSPPGIR